VYNGYMAYITQLKQHK